MHLSSFAPFSKHNFLLTNHSNFFGRTTFCQFFCEILSNLAKLGQKLANILAIFKQNIELRERSDSTRTVKRSAFCRSRRELSNAYLLAKFGFDTAENECDLWRWARCAPPPGRRCMRLFASRVPPTAEAAWFRESRLP